MLFYDFRVPGVFETEASRYDNAASFPHSDLAGIYGE